MLPILTVPVKSITARYDGRLIVSKLVYLMSGALQGSVLCAAGFVPPVHLGEFSHSRV